MVLTGHCLPRISKQEQEDGRITSGGMTILGADDVAGVAFEILNQTAKGAYTMGLDEGRAAVLLFNDHTRKTPEKTIEYFL